MVQLFPNHITYFYYFVGLSILTRIILLLFRWCFRCARRNKKITPILSDITHQIVLAGNPRSLSEISQARSVGSLTVYTGPMFCGKTSHLVADLTRWADICSGSEICQRSARPLLINCKKDTRDPANTISSHSSSYKGLSQYVDIVAATTLKEVDVAGRNVIGVDEAQFFPDLVETIEIWLNLGINVYCAGLDSDSNMHIFGHIHELLHIADSFVKLPAICSKCLQEMSEVRGPVLPANLPIASFSARYVHSLKDQVVIGGADIYMPACRYHLKEELRIQAEEK